MSDSLRIRNVRVVTPPPGDGFRRGGEVGVLEVIDGAEVLVKDGVIVRVGPARGDGDGDGSTAGPGSAADPRSIANPGNTADPESVADPRGATDLQDSDPSIPVVDAQGRVLVPGFVDAHTHACWAGDRLDEWALRLRGASYPEILQAGGGIHSTVRAVRAASEDELAAALAARLDWALREGTTTIEVKSGYGLGTEAELKMLRAIERAGKGWAGTVVATACIGHAKDPEVPDFVTYTIKDTLPAVHEAFPGVTIDAYCEAGAWTVNECVRLLEAARALGHPLRIHADQFTELGMLDEAVRLGARSVDHLEASSPEALARLARSSGAGVFLPISGFHVDGRYGNARALVDHGGAPVVATNWNPGSAPSPSIPLAMGLAVRRNGLTAHEALTAVTANPAHLLRLPDRGRIAVGMRADLVLLRHRDERELAHTVGGSAIAWVMAGGVVNNALQL